MRFAVFVVAALACSAAFASEPGQPLDCSDMQFLVPGLNCVALAPFDQPDSRFIGHGQNMAIDNNGNIYIGTQSPTGAPTGIDVQRSRDGGQTVEVVARLSARSAPQGSDSTRFINNRDSGSANGSNQPNDIRVLFDPVGGRLLVWLVSECNGACPCGSNCYGNGYGGKWIAAITGFTTLFDVLESFAPQPTALGFRVPYMPEGMAGADSFDTYWGPLTKPLDFTQAHPLACDYPATAPQVGDYLTVADSVPTPAPGAGVYYVTSATYQGATRYGRKTTAGHLTGRDPALLPVCTP